MYVVTADPIAAIRAEARWRAANPALSARLWRAMRRAWLRRRDERAEFAARATGHAGVLADYQVSCRGSR